MPKFVTHGEGGGGLQHFLGFNKRHFVMFVS